MELVRQNRRILRPRVSDRLWNLWKALEFDGKEEHTFEDTSRPLKWINKSPGRFKQVPWRIDNDRVMYYETNDVCTAWMQDLQALGSNRTMILGIVCSYQARTDHSHDFGTLNVKLEIQ
jgi:hypothetical protein